MSQLGDRYGAAFFELVGDEKGDFSKTLKQLGDFSNTWNSSPELSQEFASPSATHKVRASIVTELCSALGITGTTQKFLLLLAEKQRLTSIGDIYDAFRTLVQKSTGEVVAHVRTATPLKDSEQKRLHAALEKVSGKKIILDITTEPDLIAGLVCELEGKVLDGSLQNRLGLVRERVLKAN